MASSTKLAFAVVTVLLLQTLWCAMARHHHDPELCGDSVLLDNKDHRCRSFPADTQGESFLAVMSETSFDQDGGGPAACDGQYHNNGDFLAALSTKWYAGGSRCQISITIKSEVTGLTALATVVDECDSQSGCPDNMIATSKAVWDALGEDTNYGEVSVFWSTST